MENNNPTIVIVDDDSIITDTISTYLELSSDYKVLAYNNPKTALAELESKSFDVVISDFMMPEMNGLDFLSKVKKLRPDAVMILLTGYADKENAIRAINELELYQYIEKPWDNEELSMVIKNGLEKKNLIVELTSKNEEISRLYELLKKDYQSELENVENVMVALAKAIEAKDKYTEGHTDRVSHIAVKIGERLKLDDQALKILKIGGAVHDIGKIGVPEHILNKPGKLDPEEFDVIKRHPAMGEDICKPLKSVSYTLSVIRHHHEKLDGSGYPDGLSGDSISLEARIIAVADIYDAISSDRPYRKKMTEAEVKAVLETEKQRGTLDPQIVDILFDLMDQNQI